MFYDYDTLTEEAIHSKFIVTITKIKKTDIDWIEVRHTLKDDTKLNEFKEVSLKKGLYTTLLYKFSNSQFLKKLFLNYTDASFALLHLQNMLSSYAYIISYKLIGFEDQFRNSITSDPITAQEALVKNYTPEEIKDLSLFE